MIPLGLLTAGEKAEVVETRMEELLSPCSACKRKGAGGVSRIEDMGLRVGKIIEILNNSGGQGALLIKVDDSRIALNRGMAMKIMVRRKD